MLLIMANVLFTFFVLWFTMLRNSSVNHIEDIDTNARKVHLFIKIRLKLIVTNRLPKISLLIKLFNVSIIFKFFY